MAVGIEPARRGCALTLSHADVPRGDLRALAARWLGVLYGLAETLDVLRPTLRAPARGSARGGATAVTSASAG